MKFHSLEKYAKWAGPMCALVVVALAAPAMLLGEDAWFTIHDNLDSEVSYLHVLHASGTAYSTDPSVRIDQVMNGIPRAFYRSGWNLTVFLFGLFPLHWAYIINALLSHLIALFGMRYLLKRHVLTKPSDDWATWLIGLGFAVLPFYSTYGCTVPAQPLLLSGFLSLRKGNATRTDALLIIVFPFVVLNYMVTPFAIAVLGAMGAWDVLRARRINWRYWGMLVMLGLLFLTVEVGLLRSMFGPEAYASHRQEWRIDDLMPTGFGEGVAQAVSFFLHGHYHTGLFYSVPILMAVVVAVLLGRGATPVRNMLFVLGCAALFIAIFPIYFWLIHEFGDRFPFISYFTGNRFFFLAPLCWLMVLGYAAVVLLERAWGRWLLAAVCGLHVLYAVRNDEETMNDLRQLSGEHTTTPNYRGFYARDVFSAMKARIGAEPSSYRVACLGLPPNIAQVNGLYTLDSYQNNYELSYKHAFRPIIETELDKSDELSEYFDAWGSRCYLWSAELGQRYDLHKGNGLVLRNTLFDLDAFRALGGRYIISAVGLEGPMAGRLEHLGIFNSNTSAWELNLYRVR